MHEHPFIKEERVLGLIIFDFQIIARITHTLMQKNITVTTNMYSLFQKLGYNVDILDILENVQLNI